ncbi:putative toxin-antitoxin system toxin component, PIN family [Candidatus Oleimmundimicrobium sp.]|uniref:putative toxin-antitoxin system toxin component, PIN family n=1 Tax=Candidatus Oleimmundimicrobium sp. TaxID=3060597 RepID=UPI00271FD85D|nr:putative toxin-antitoxin system toxin component, PIN family [Candidatus Oleimmundimicrobium sp.]MDO8886864.1 putative toxin-antitoxin system toxin component, PIN family [Candidatus Oleimmundimicrobium sp.]
MLRVVYDSNVFISALLFDGPPRVILEMARGRKVVLITSKPILTETARKLREKFKWPEHNIQKFLKQMNRLAEIVNPKDNLNIIIEDESDNRILECALVGQAHLIISGDKHLLRLKQFQNIPIKKPKYLTYLIKE